jgi:hypothetical protein
MIRLGRSVLRISAAMVLPWIATPSAVSDEAAIGFVKTASLHAGITHNGTLRDAAIGMAVYEQDVLETGRDGQVGVTFKDDTRVALGPNTRVVIKRFVFAPADKHYGFVLRLLIGTMQYLSGLSAKLSPQSTSIETPTATVGVRGTRLLIRAEH